MREVLNVRLTRGVTKDRLSLRRRCRHKGVLGRGDAGLIEKDVRADKTRDAQSHETLLERHLRAELLERKEVSVETASADHVAAWRGQRYLAAPGEERRGKQYRRSDLRAQLRVEVSRMNFGGLNCQRVRRAPVYLHPD